MKIKDPEGYEILLFKRRFSWIYNYFHIKYIKAEIWPDVRQIAWLSALEANFDENNFSNSFQRNVYAYLTKRFDFRKTKQTEPQRGGYIPKFGNIHKSTDTRRDI